MNVIQDITIDVSKPRQTVMHVVQEDSTRKIRLTLLKDNLPFNVQQDLTGETVYGFVEFRKADGHGGMYDTTSLGDPAVELEDAETATNVWIVSLDGNCFTCPGWTQINVRFETEDGKRIHTFRIMVDVEPTASSDTESTDWGELNSIADLRNAVAAMWDKMFPPEAKQALIACFEHVGWKGTDGREYLDALEAAMFQTAQLISISAVFDQGSATVYDTDGLDTLRQYLTVTATYEDLSEREITGYTLSGTLTEGTSTITVSYGGKTATFEATVTKYTPLWETENQAFNGGNIDPILYNQPGVYIPLLSTDKDWTVLYDVELETSPTSGDGSAYKLMRLTNSAAAYYSFAFGKSASDATEFSFWYMATSSSDVINFGSASTGRHRFVVTHAVNSGFATLKYKKENGDLEIVTINAEFVPSTKNLVLGQSSGINQLPKGTINKVAVYDCIVSNDVINNFFA